MITKRTGLLLGSLLVAGLTLSACGATPAPEPEAGEGPSGNITFIVPQGAYAANAFEAFEDENPNINLTLQEVPVASYKQQIRTQTQTGDLPDVMQLPGGPDGEALVKAGVPMDLAEALDSAPYSGEGTWRETFNEGVLEQASATFLTQADYADGQQWFVPQSLVSVAAVYNKAIFEEVGIEPPTSWSEFTDNNKALVAAGYTPMSYLGAQAPDWWPKMAWDQTAGDVTRDQIESGEVDFSDPHLVEGLQIVADMYADGFFPEAAFVNGTEEEQALFLSGRTAQFIHVGATGRFVAENAGFEVGAFVLPGALDVEPVRPVGGATANVVVNAETENPEAAIHFVKYLTSEGLYETQVDNFMISPLAVQPTGGTEIYEVFASAIRNGSANAQTWFQTFDPEDYDKLNKEIYPSVIRGDITAEEAGDMINELFNS